MNNRWIGMLAALAVGGAALTECIQNHAGRANASRNVPVLHSNTAADSPYPNRSGAPQRCNVGLRKDAMLEHR